jgi:hypothetical protein
MHFYPSQPIAAVTQVFPLQLSKLYEELRKESTSLEMIEGIINPLLQEINKDKKSQKIFRKVFNLSSAERQSQQDLEVHSIATLLLSQRKNLDLSYFDELKSRLAEHAMRISKQIIPLSDNSQKHIPSALKKVPLVLLRALTRESWKELNKLLIETDNLVKSKKLNDDRQNAHLDEIIHNLHVRYLHFLAKGAKIPIFDQHKGVITPYHLPLIEYINDNYPLYYRGDGGVAVQLFLAEIEKHFPQEEVSEYEFRVIKNDEYPFFIKPLCRSCNVIYLDEDEQVKEEEPDTDQEENYFLDITSSLASHNPYEFSLSGYLQLVNKTFESMEEKPLVKEFMIGGVIKVGGQDLFVSKRAFKIIEAFANFQYTLGYIPEMLQMKHHLLKSGFSLADLKNQYFPFPSILPSSPSNYSSRLEDIQEKYARINEALEADVAISLEISSCYLPILNKLIKFMHEHFHELSKWKKNPVFLACYAQALDKIFKKLKKIYSLSHKEGALFSLPPQQKFQEVQQEFSLIFEKIEYLMVLMDIKLDIYEALEEMKLFTTDRYAYTSGMRCFIAITEAILSLFKSSFKSSDKKEAIFIEGCYYELREEERGFDKFIKKNFNSSSMRLQDALDSPDKLCQANVIYSDLYPNDITLDEVKKIEVVNLINSALTNRSSENKSPLIFVLDTATSLFFDEEIAEINQAVKEWVENKKLIFVVTSSLAKFTQAGLDKYTGGVVLVSAHPDYSHFTKELIIHQDRDVFSIETQRFHSLMLTRCPEEIENYVKKIKKNTDYVYERLKEKLGENSFIHLGKKDPNIPMIGLHFDSILKKMEIDKVHLPVLIYIMQHYIYSKTTQVDLPLCVRGSFGFPHAACIECETALRLTVGIEDQILLEQYVEIICALQEEITLMMNSEEAKKLLSSIISPKHTDSLAKSPIISMPEKDNISAYGEEEEEEDTAQYDSEEEENDIISYNDHIRTCIEDNSIELVEEGFKGFQAFLKKLASLSKV